MKDRDERKLEKARVRVSTMLTLASELGTGIGPDEICREPMIAPLSPVALRSAVMAANLILLAVDHLALTLAGGQPPHRRPHHSSSSMPRILRAGS